MTDAKAMRHMYDAKTDFFKNIGLNILYCACGTLITRGAVLGTMAPFGASYAAAVPKERLLPSLAGAAFGYVLLNPSDSFRYIAVIVAIGCARWLLSDIGRVSDFYTRASSNVCTRRFSSYLSEGRWNFVIV